jgi:hypothetical protein
MILGYNELILLENEEVIVWEKRLLSMVKLADLSPKRPGRPMETELNISMLNQTTQN